MTQEVFAKLCGLLSGSLPVAQVSLADWSLVVQQARSAQVLGTLCARLTLSGQLDAVPQPVRWHLDAANVMANKNYRDARVEIRQFLPIFSGLNIPLVLLKGTAYLASEAEFARGRVFSDIDILVPEERLKDLEDALRWYGWTNTYHSKYDQKYYRQWMHELPPLMHRKRGTVLDIHHTILPLTARLHPPAEKLFEDVAPVQALKGVSTLSPPDMILHSATHLFMDSEFDHAFRDLLDIDGLIRLYDDGTESCWQGLLDRGQEMDLLPPLFYGLRYARRILKTPVPDSVLERCEALWRPTLPLPWMDSFFERILRPAHASCAMSGTNAARSLFHLRGHYLRMPLTLLAYHLSRKAVLAPFSSTEPAAA